MSEELGSTPRPEVHPSPFEEQLRQFAARETGTAMSLQQTPWVSRLVQSIVDEAVRLYDRNDEDCIC